MKKALVILIMALLTSTGVNAQLSDSIALGQGYVNQVFYNMTDGEISEVSNTDWDIAFNTELTGYSIRTNGGNGTILYGYPDGDSSDWDVLDTLGLSNWPSYYNSDKTWNTGAFNQTEFNLDVGWGQYNSITHVVTGDSLYVIQLSNGDFKKLWIEELATGTYTFRYADIDHSNEESISFSKGDYAGKNFVYYSIQNEEFLDKEPQNTTWDLVFTKYVSEIVPGQFYGVTGALSNFDTNISQAYPVDVEDANYWDYEFEEDINVIGYDWKSFNNDTFQYVIEDSLTYFVNDQEGNIWQMIFTGFGGSSDGKMYFTKELISTASIEEADSDISNLTLFPNPISGGQTQVLFVTDAPTVVSINVYDLTGKLVQSENFASVSGINQTDLSVSNLTSGIYILSIEANSWSQQEKFVIK